VGSNSFQVNSASEEQKLFPLGFTLLAAESGVFRASLHAQSLREVADLIVSHALGRACLFDVDHTMMEPGTRELRSLGNIAATAGVSLVPLDSDAYLLATSELPKLLEHLDHFNLSLLDVPPSMTPEDAYREMLDSADWGGRASPPALDFAKRSSLFLSSHDDCYLYLEARSRHPALAHFARLLQEYVAALAGVAAGEVAPPPVEILESLLAATGSCSMFDSNSRRDGGLLRLGRDGRRYRLGDAPMPPEGWVRYDLAERLWSAE
jgi:hypothetical protein